MLVFRWACALTLAALAPAALHAQQEILFVLGSDTSTPGIRVDRFGTVYPASGFGMFADASRQGYRIMDPAFRARYRDTYGTPLKLTWWMQGGSLYRYADNTNVPLGSTMSAHLMYRYHRAALADLGDEMSFHYHSWAWTDYDGDRRFFWNQAKSFDEVRADFDRTLAEHLIEEDLFPVSFRSGWHYMDDAWQARLDSLLPFSLHNASPSKHSDPSEPLDNVYDWSRATQTFVPFKPSPTDYQRPGGTRGWNTRSRYLKSATDDAVRSIFEAARAGERQVVCLWSHLAEGDFVEQVEAAAEAIARVSADYPDVPFRYATAVEAMQRWLQTTDTLPPTIGIEEVTRPGGTVLRLTSDEALFQPVPFVARLDRYGRYDVLDVAPAGTNTWETAPFDAALAAHVAVAATDTSGNLTTKHLRYVPDDVYADNGDAGYEAFGGPWATVPAGEEAQVWDRDYHRAVLSGNGTTRARWHPAVTEEATYQVFVRLPADVQQAAAFDVVLRVDGVAVDSLRFDTPPPVAEWTYAGTARFRPGADNVVEMAARAGEPAGRVLAADAVRLTARIHDRHLTFATTALDLGDLAVRDTARAGLPLRNDGTGTITISHLYSRHGGLALDAPLPFVLGPMQRADLPLTLVPTRQGFFQDTLVVESDDPLEPLRLLPVAARVFDHFVTLDDADPSGYTETGPWQTSVTEAYGPSSRFAYVGAPAGTAARFSGTADRDGTYAWFYLVPRTTNAAVRARYVVSAGAQAADTLVVDQNFGSGTWRALGLYPLQAGDDFRVEVSWADRDQEGRVLRADALRLMRVGTALREQIVDNDGGDYREEGPWFNSVSRASYGPSSRYTNADGNGRAFFTTRAEQSGMHGLYTIVPTTVNAARQAVYRVRLNTATLDSVFVDQNAGSGAWRFLGAYWLAEGDSVTVEVAHYGPAEPGYVLRTDALRLVSGSEATPIAAAAAPGGFALGPNHPNPASATTSFTFTLDTPAPVRVRLYDVLGREVARLADGPYAPGRHAVRFDTSGLPGGVYLCRLESGTRIATRAWVVTH